MHFETNDVQSLVTSSKSQEKYIVCKTCSIYFCLSKGIPPMIGLPDKVDDGATLLMCAYHLATTMNLQEIALMVLFIDHVHVLGG